MSRTSDADKLVRILKTDWKLASAQNPYAGKCVKSGTQECACHICLLDRLRSLIKD